jgi:hypothetical protein
MPEESQTYADLDHLLEQARHALAGTDAPVSHLLQMATMFDRVVPEQRQELISQFHDQAGRVPYVNDSDLGSILLERTADASPEKEFRRRLYAESLYRARWCAQAGTGPGEGLARSRHVHRIEFKLSGIQTMPGETELAVSYWRHLGPRCEAAGITLQFHYNQPPGTHFKVDCRAEYTDAILRGIEDGMALRFPNFPSTGSIWVTGINEHPVDSSQMAFYRAARSAIEQAYFLPTISYVQIPR